MNSELRLRRLERRCKLLTIAFVLVAGLFLFSGAIDNDSRTLRAHRLEIIDEQGVPRFVLGRSPELQKGKKPTKYQTSYGYAVFSAEGQLLGTLQADKSGSRFAMFHSLLQDEEDDLYDRSAIYMTAYGAKPTIDLQANGKMIKRLGVTK